MVAVPKHTHHHRRHSRDRLPRHGSASAFNQAARAAAGLVAQAAHFKRPALIATVCYHNKRDTRYHTVGCLLYGMLVLVPHDDRGNILAFRRGTLKNEVGVM